MDIYINTLIKFGLCAYTCAFCHDAVWHILSVLCPTESQKNGNQEHNVFWKQKKKQKQNKDA